MRQDKGRAGRGTTLPLALLCAGMLMLFTGRAEAEVAMGPYLDLSNGSGNFEWDSDNFEFDVDSRGGAIGFAMDFDRSYQSNFSYRLNIGLESQDLEDEFGDTLEMGGIVVENVFCFAVVDESGFRWWAGPLVRIGFYSGETDDFYDSYGDRHRTEADLFEFGVGLATGFDLQVGENTYFAPSAGIRFIGASGSGTDKNLDQRTQFEDDLEGNITTLFVNFSLLFD